MFSGIGQIKNQYLMMENVVLESEPNERIRFDVEKMFKMKYDGLHFRNLFDILIHSETIVLDLGFTDMLVEYHSKNGFTAPQLLYLFARQYEHEMATFGEADHDQNSENEADDDEVKKATLDEDEKVTLDEDEIATFDEIKTLDMAKVIDEKDMEGKWRTFADSNEREDCCGRTLDDFEYDPITKIVYVGSSS